MPPSVSTQAPCPLCARLATLQAREAAWHVTCPHCFRFTLDPYLLDLFESARQRTDVRVLRLLPRLSDAARHTAAGGGNSISLVRTGERQFAPPRRATRTRLIDGARNLTREPHVLYT
jgi:hypothetical protein